MTTISQQEWDDGAKFHGRNWENYVRENNLQRAPDVTTVSQQEWDDGAKFHGRNWENYVRENNLQLARNQPQGRDRIVNRREDQIVPPMPNEQIGGGFVPSINQPTQYSPYSMTGQYKEAVQQPVKKGSLWGSGRDAPTTQFNQETGLWGWNPEEQTYYSDSRNYQQRDDGAFGLTPQASAAFSQNRADRKAAAAPPPPPTTPPPTTTQPPPTTPPPTTVPPPPTTPETAPGIPGYVPAGQDQNPWGQFHQYQTYLQNQYGNNFRPYSQMQGLYQQPGGLYGQNPQGYGQPTAPPTNQLGAPQSQPVNLYNPYG